MQELDTMELCVGRKKKQEQKKMKRRDKGKQKEEKEWRRKNRGKCGQIEGRSWLQKREEQKIFKHFTIEGTEKIHKYTKYTNKFAWEEWFNWQWNFAHPLEADPDNCWQYPNTEQQFVGRKNVIKSNLLFEHFLFAYVIRCSTLHHLSR